MRAIRIVPWLLVVTVSALSQNRPTQTLDRFNVKWIHGSNPCSTNTDPAFQVHRFDDSTYILRQNRCLHYEAPFIYLMFGSDKVFMQDTGAPAPLEKFPLRDTIQKIIDDWLKTNGREKIELVVTHSHAHGDHVAGDVQFMGKPNTTIVGTSPGEVQRFFGFKDWPNDIVSYNLGGRALDIIAIPGHEPSSIAVYDRRTRVLLTGDTVYPGRLYIGDWRNFRATVLRLARFAEVNDVSYVLGTHIEMSSTPGRDYPVRTTFQPEEHSLELGPVDLQELKDAVLGMHDQPLRQVHDDFIIYPRMN